MDAAAPVCDAQPMELSEAMRTTPATRRFTDEPLPDDVLYEILDDARFAPNGGNRQAWRVVIVRDPATKARLGELYQLGWREDAAHVRAGLIPFVASEALWRNPPDGPGRPAVDLDEARRTPTDDIPGAGAQLLATPPVVLLVLLDLSRVMAMDSGLGRLSISAGGSVYPLVHNILLAARGPRLRRGPHDGARPPGAGGPRSARHPRPVRAGLHHPARPARHPDHEVAAQSRRGLRLPGAIRR